MSELRKRPNRQRAMTRRAMTRREGGSSPMWKSPRILFVSGAALVVGLGVGAAVVPALAAQDPVLTPDQQSTLQQQSDAFKACLEQQGVTLPSKPADGTRP